MGKSTQMTCHRMTGAEERFAIAESPNSLDKNPPPKLLGSFRLRRIRLIISAHDAEITYSSALRMA